MRDLYEHIKSSLLYNKFILDDIICVEYHCFVEDLRSPVLAEHDYIVHVLSGKKSWRTIDGEWKLQAGQTLFVKKGATMITQDFSENFCMLGFFLPDDLIREAINEMKPEDRIRRSASDALTAIELASEDYLISFFNSMLPYFKENSYPSEMIIRLKLKELIANIYSHCHEDEFISYLNYTATRSSPSLSSIMEANFMYNMKLEQFAKLSGRSLSKFKKDFFDYYQTTPGKWLLSKRLEHAANLLLNSTSNIATVAYDSGFEDPSHFSRAFKEKYDQSPKSFRGS